MARILAIDWEPPKLRVLAAQTGKSRARIEQSLSVTLAQELSPATAAAADRALKDALAQARVAPAPVYVAVGRDKIIFKEMSIPFVPSHEEPAVVRFQASKELTESATDLVLDYSHIEPPKAGQPTRVLVAALKRSTAAAIGSMALAAGLKVQAIVPRPFALAGLIERKSGQAIPISRALVVPAGEEDVEFSVYTAGQLVWARTLQSGAGLVGEIRRNLMLIGAQRPELAELTKIESAVPLGAVADPLEPWRDNDTRPVHPNEYLGALGLAEIAARPFLPVNLAAPKEPRQVTSTSKQQRKLAMIAAAILVPVLLLGWYWKLSAMESEIAELQQSKEELEEMYKKQEQSRVDVAALEEWQDSNISWLDELYDIAARLPHEQGLRLTQVTATHLKKKAGADAKYTGQVVIHGVMNGDHDKFVTQFVDALRNDQNLKVQGPTFRGNEYTLTVDVMARPPQRFLTKLVVPPRPKAVPMPEQMPDPEANPDE